LDVPNSGEVRTKDRKKFGQGKVFSNEIQIKKKFGAG
jgi:hypothetical protein